MLRRPSMVFRACVALLLGVVTTVLVALGCALWVDVELRRGRRYFDESTADRTGIALVRQSIGATRVEFWSLPSGQADWSGSVRLKNYTDVTRTERLQSPSHRPEGLQLPWLRPDQPLTSTTTLVYDSRGWPLYAFSGGFELTNPVGPITDHWNAIILSPTASLPTGDKSNTQIIPLAPIWSGIIYNSLIYSAAWAVLLIGPGVVRRAIRGARGRCISCGYDLRGADHVVCPECGFVLVRSSTHEESKPARLG